MGAHDGVGGAEVGAGGVVCDERAEDEEERGGEVKDAGACDDAGEADGVEAEDAFEGVVFGGDVDEAVGAGDEAVEALDEGFVLRARADLGEVDGGEAVEFVEAREFLGGEPGGAAAAGLVEQGVEFGGVLGDAIEVQGFAHGVFRIVDSSPRPFAMMGVGTISHWPRKLLCVARRHV